MRSDAPVNDIVSMRICLVKALIDRRGVVVIVNRNRMLNQLRQSHIYAFFSRHGAEWKKGASREEGRSLLCGQILSEFDVCIVLGVYNVLAPWLTDSKRVEVEDRDSLGTRGSTSTVLVPT
jgi:hypothetical protein